LLRHAGGRNRWPVLQGLNVLRLITVRMTSQGSCVRSFQHVSRIPGRAAFAEMLHDFFEATTTANAKQVAV
jgi:hypothetical protein